MPLMLPRLALMPMLLLVAACVSSPPIIATQAPCSTLVPEAWRSGVGVPPLDPARADDTDLDRLKTWQKFALAAAASVQTSDSRLKDALGIIERCEQRDAAAAKRARRRLLGVF